jgi:phospholipase C
MNRTGQLFSLLALVGACGTTIGTRDLTCRPLADSPQKSATATSGSAFKGTVFTIVMENESQSDVLGSGDAPYINSLAAQSAVALGYRDALVHPSEPNYIWMAAGENFGILDDDDPVSHHIASTSHLVDQLEAAGISWKAYQESMGTPCTFVSTSLYKAKHDPFIYFDDLVSWNGTTGTATPRCQEHVVDYSELATDLASGDVPRYVFITPNIKNDMHDTNVATGDRWLAANVPQILASKAFQDGGVLFLTWDEGSLQSDNPPMIVVSPLAKKGLRNYAKLDTSSYLKTVERILGVDALPCDPSPETISTMDALFTAPLPPATE